LQRRKTRTRRPELGAALAAALCLAGCGGGSEPRVSPQPKLAKPVASALSERSDLVAQALAAGDSCRALSAARELQREAIAAINAGRVPRPFQEHLGSTVNDLVARIRCVPPAADREDNGKHKGKHKGKKNEGDD
jgi:hypothetical protein